MSSFSTHVLDATLGAPAAAVTVTLSRRDGAEWTELATGTTDADGRWRAPDTAPLTAGVDHRIRFDLDTAAGSFFPEVTITFRPATTGRHHHVPLLLSPFSYSTYLGS